MIGEGGDGDNDGGPTGTLSLDGGDGCCGDVGEDGKMMGSAVVSR